MKKAIPLFIALLLILCAAFAISAYAEGAHTTVAADTPAATGGTQAYPEITSISAENSGVRISWKEYKGADSYRVFIKGSEGWESIDDTSELSFLYEYAPMGTESVYTVRAMDESGDYISDYSDTGWTHTYLEEPELLSLVNTDKGQKLSWKKVDGAQLYRVYISRGSSWEKLADTKGLSYETTGASNNTAYTYTVGCVSPDGSTAFSGYDAKGLTTRFFEIPTITSVESVEDGSKITWRSVDGVSKYRVFVKAVVGWRVVQDVSDTSCVHKNVAQGTSYTYTVRALDDQGNFVSAYSPKGYTAKYQTAPVLTNVVPSKDGVILCWMGYGGAEKYRVYRSTVDTGWKGVADVTGLMYTDKSAPDDEPCRYTVRALDASGSPTGNFVDDGRFFCGSVVAHGSVIIKGYKCIFDRGELKKGYVTIQDILDIAEAEVGTKARDSMICKYNTWYYGYEVSGDCYAWCVVFFEWVFEQANARELLFNKTNGAEYFGLEFYNNGGLVTSDYKVGDLLLLHWSEGESSYVPGVQLCNHVAIVKEINPDGTFTTIEGNTGDDPNGEVLVMTRRPDQVSCACRPKYGFFIPA